LLPAFFSLTGCAVYSETRHKQGEAAREAWKSVDIAGQLGAARKGEAALLAEQLKTEEALQKARRSRSRSSCWRWPVHRKSLSPGPPR
jgi:hypothetical protein